jgi:hypothetical protein
MLLGQRDHAGFLPKTQPIQPRFHVRAKKNADVDFAVADACQKLVASPLT